MALIKYNRPNTDLFSKTFNDIVDEFFNEERYRRDSFIPSVDIAEDEEQFTISASLPGMKKDDISIDLENGRLSISGERKMETEEKNRNYHRVESQYGSFSRSFYLPDTIDEETVQAKYEDGVLNISIQKSKEKVKKQIEIQ